jgi:hypothetical protein
VKTLSGERKLNVRFMYCKTHGMVDTGVTDVVNRICPPGYIFDSKVMIAVGLLRWFCNLQREEIQVLLMGRGTSISTGEISNLSEEFLLRFYVLHRKHISQMNDVFHGNNGMVFHLDGTGEAGDDIVFSAKEGITGFTLDACILPSESKTYLKPFLEKIHDSFGVPLVVMRDMSRQIQEAVSEVYPGVLQLICHYHFVKNLGGIVFKDRYETLRSLIVGTKILSQLATLKENILNDTMQGSLLVRGECLWVSLAVEYLLWPRERASNYPFVLPYFEIMRRIAEVKQLVGRIIRWNRDHNCAVGAVLTFSEKIECMHNTKQVMKQFYHIERIYGWFEEIRDILNVQRHLSGNGQKNTLMNIENIRVTLDQILARIDREVAGLDEPFHKVAKTISDQFQKHREELFAEVYDANGDIIEIVRHNGIEERSHRWGRMHNRRRTGRNKTTKDMIQYGGLLAVLSNLENKTYVEDVLSDVTDLVYAMQNVTSEEIKEAKKMMNVHSRKRMVRSDKIRAGLLSEFVDLLERTESQNHVSLQDWLYKLEIPTPK